MSTSGNFLVFASFKSYNYFNEKTTFFQLLKFGFVSETNQTSNHNLDPDTGFFLSRKVPRRHRDADRVSFAGIRSGLDEWNSVIWAIFILMYFLKIYLRWNLQFLNFQEIYTLLGFMSTVRPWSGENKLCSFGVYWYPKIGEKIRVNTILF